jgi:hypothetical protein
VCFSGSKEKNPWLLSWRKRRQKLLAPERPDLGRSEDENARLSGAEKLAQVIGEMNEKVATDMHGIVDGGSFDVNSAHDAFIVSEWELGV